MVRRNPLQPVGIGRCGGNSVGVCGRFGNHLIVFLRQVVQVFRRRPFQPGGHVRFVRIRLALRRLHNLRQPCNVPAKQFFQRRAVSVADLALAKPHAVGVVGEFLLVAVVTYIFRKLVKGVVGVGVRQLAISLTGQHLRNHAAILVVGISNLIFPVDHGRQLVTLVVAHLQRSFYAVRAGQHLFGHVSGLVVGILLLVARALQEAGQLPQRVIGIGALRGLAALCAHLSRDVAVLVVAVAERNLARAAGRLREQIAYAVIAV